MAYLERKGIAKSSMTPKGYGETNLVNNCYDSVQCSEAEHQENRRTEVLVIA